MEGLEAALQNLKKIRPRNLLFAGCAAFLFKGKAAVRL